MNEAARMQDAIEQLASTVTPPLFPVDEMRLGATSDQRPIFSDWVRELARVRKVLKAGRCDEGRERLERVLGEMDAAWRTLA